MSKKTTTPKAAATAADAVHEWLGAHPGSHGLDVIVEAVPHTASTVKTALAKLTEAGQIRATNDGDGGVQAWTADPDPAAGAGAEVTDDQADHLARQAAPDDHGHGGVDAVETEGEPDAAVDDAGRDSAGQGGESVPVQTDLRVFGIAFMLSQASEDGITVPALALKTGHHTDQLWPLLIAMHTAGAATCRNRFVLDPDNPNEVDTFLLDPNATWHPGTTDASAVNTTTTPTAVDCPLCGSANPIPGQAKKKAAKSRSRGDGQPVGTAGRTWAPGELIAEVKTWIANNPATPITPGHITRDIGGNSSGAVRNILETMTAKGELTRIPDTTPATWKPTQ